MISSSNYHETTIEHTKPISIGFRVAADLDTPSEVLRDIKTLLLDALEAYEPGNKDAEALKASLLILC